jgi:hypothetical protein
MLSLKIGRLEHRVFPILKEATDLKKAIEDNPTNKDLKAHYGKVIDEVASLTVGDWYLYFDTDRRRLIAIGDETLKSLDAIGETIKPDLYDEESGAYAKRIRDAWMERVTKHRKGE